MADALVATKLYIPGARLDSIERPNLTELLQSGVWRQFTLVSAPAGFGKTTLVGEWVRRSGQPTAWISLDAQDSDPPRFLAYFVAALQEIRDDIGEGALETLYASPSSSLATVLPDLLNQIASMAKDFTLVLDDYHVITDMKVHGFVESLLDNIPRQMHLVIISRADPPLPLSRLRARGQMTEVREADLRFTRDEARAFLSGIMRIDLSSDEIDVLEDRTEGWVAGLQMAALSMRGDVDVSKFVSAFAGDDRHILDFLVDEVLERQSTDVQRFLLRTSVLDRLTGNLCDAVTGQSDGNAMLRNLEQANLFVVPLDDKREWYRYHHLFAEMLQAKQAEAQPDWGQVAHSRASVWYEAQGALNEAVHHAIEAEDFERAGDLIGEVVANYFGAFQPEMTDAEVFGWSGRLRQLPTSLVPSRPYLGFLDAWWLLRSGLVDAAEARMIQVESQMETPVASLSSTSDHVATDDEFADASMLAQMIIFRAIIARDREDMRLAEKLSRQVLSLVPESHRLHETALLNLGRVSWSEGDISSALQFFSTGFSNSRRYDWPDTQMLMGGNLARIQIVQGRLNDATGTYDQVLLEAEQISDASHAAGSAGTVLDTWSSGGYIDVRMGICDLLRERNQLQDAAINLEKGVEISGRMPVTPYYPLLTMAQLRRAEGKLDEAVDAVEQAEQLTVSDSMSALLFPATVFKVLLWLDGGRLEQAIRWAEECAVSVTDEPTYLNEFEHLTFARVLIAKHASDPSDDSLQAVLGLLDRLAQAADAAGRNGSLIEVLIVRSLAYQAVGGMPGALQSITSALEMAEPEGYVRVFLDEGEPMRPILRDAVAKGIAVSYAESLLAAFDTHAAISADSATTSEVQQPDSPLSARETEILRLIAAGKTNQEIADRLFIVLDTVKRHVTHIYAKLDVQRRPQAIARAQEIGLI